MLPIHPALVHFPIALLVFSVLADLFGKIGNSAALRAAGRWALFGALIGAAVAIPAGFFDWSRQDIGPEVREHVRLHMIVGLVLFVTLVGLNLWRWFFIDRDPQRGSLGWPYLIAGALALGLTFYQGYLGHELVVDHGVGVKSSAHGAAPGKTQEHGSEHGH